MRSSSCMQDRSANHVGKHTVTTERHKSIAYAYGTIGTSVGSMPYGYATRVESMHTISQQKKKKKKVEMFFYCTILQNTVIR